MDQIDEGTRGMFWLVCLCRILATTADEELELSEIEGLLGTIVKEINGAQNRVRYTMINFVIAVGTYVRPLLKQAKTAARQIDAVSVDLGDTACEIRPASAQIEKMEASGRVGKRRKTLRC
jgi:hypothetical protein